MDFERIKNLLIDQDKISSRGTVRINILEFAEILIVLVLLIVAKAILSAAGLYDYNVRFVIRLAVAIWFYFWLIRVSGLTKLGALIAAIIMLI